MKLFLPQSTLESWASEEKADVSEGHLVVPAEKARYPIVGAVHFLQVVSGEDDRKLLQRVKTEDQLKTLGAEQMGDSVLLGDTAYQVAPGFVAEVALPKGKGADPKKPSAEADMLAAFLLGKP